MSTTATHSYLVTAATVALRGTALGSTALGSTVTLRVTALRGTIALGSTVRLTIGLVRICTRLIGVRIHHPSSSRSASAGTTISCISAAALWTSSGSARNRVSHVRTAAIVSDRPSRNGLTHVRPTVVVGARNGIVVHIVIVNGRMVYIRTASVTPAVLVGRLPLVVTITAAK